ncbi:DKNYY domain-containing protein [Pseudoalteromonas carrageenovora]|uniref:DKNYY domain-containing protein n=1 Tax=Pseudoalteromonas carrageenovora TaxID=227 RepID=UPI00311E381E
MGFWTWVLIIFIFFAVVQGLDFLFPTLRKKSQLFNFFVSDPNSSLVFSGAVNSELSDSYYFSLGRKEIRYSPMGNWFALGNELVLGADLATFEVIDRNYAKDQYNIYYCEKTISHQVDYASFEMLREDIVKDKFNVFIHRRSLPTEVADTIDPEHEFNVFNNADPATFTLLDDEWSKDYKCHFYNFIEQDIDYDTFVKLTELIVKDKEAVYIKSNNDVFIKTDVKGSNVKALDEEYIYDGARLYWYENDRDEDDTFITWLDSIEYKNINSLKIVGSGYLIVDEKVFLGTKQIANAQAEKFELLSNPCFSMDTECVFYNGLMLKNAEAKIFHLLSDHSDYASDEQNIYYQNNELEGVNAQCFELLDSFSLFGHDGKNVYFKHHKISDVDISSIEVISHHEAIKDAKNVYWGANKVLGADPETFTCIQRKYDAEDKNGFYKNGILVKKK